MKARNIILNLSAFFLILMPVFSMAQSEWMVSADKQAQKSPVAFTPVSVKAGKQVFMTNCKSCHGDLTKDNGLPLIPKPTDLGLQAFLDKNSDGSIFNKITDGQATMPTFKSILSAEQRWNIVNYIRSFDANHKVAAAVPIENNIEQKSSDIGKPYSLDVKVDVATTEAIVTFYGTSNGQKVPVKGAEIFVGIKRYFGNLPITDMGVTTDENGQIKTVYPCDMPSGESGDAVLVAYPIDKDLYGDISAKADLVINTCHPSEFKETRALWANRAHFPIWLIITYLSMVIIAWGVMVKAVLNVIKIKKLGN
jgi:mono/diheme cytochrome c family protein